MSSLPAPTGGGEEVPAFLHELVPFRCPVCGHSRHFPTLRELRQHLQHEHKFKMGFVKPHTRAQLFDQKRGNRGNSNSSNSSSNITNNTYNHTGSADWRAALRESSPLLQTFKNEANQLENELLRAKEMELKHKTMSMQSLAKGSGFEIPENKRPAAENMEKLHLNYEVKTKQKPASSDFQSSVQNKFVKEYLDKQNWLYSGPRRTTTTSDIHNQDTLLLRTPLTTEHYQRQYPSGRAPQEGIFNPPTTIEHPGAALARSDEVLKEMEEFAEERCRQQRQIIEELVQDMRAKEVDLNHLATERDRLQEDRSRLRANTERLVTHAGEYGTSVRQAHDDRGALLDSVSEELGKLRDLSEQELRARENEAKTAWGRCQTAEWERDRLSAETERLLLRADADTERLRRTLQAKDDRLAQANTELDRVRFEQESVLEKTLRVYRAAEESRQAARVAMETKEGQLQEAGHQMDAMAALHQRLVEQSRILTEQADENTSQLQRLLKVKVEQINDLMTQLDTLRAEKRRLEENSGSLAELAEVSQSEVDGLRTLVGEKEAELRTTHAQLEELKKFLQDTAAKERKARAELQNFIEELIDRTQRAEAELHTLKSLSASATLNNATTVEPSSLSHAVDSSERTGLPVALSTNDIPLKNSRRNTTSNVSHSHTPAWRSGLPLFSDVSDTNVHNPKPPKVPSDASRRRKYTPKTSSRNTRDGISMKTDKGLHNIDNLHRRSETQRNIGSADEEVQDWQESSGEDSISGSEYIPIRERQSDSTDSSEIEQKENMPNSDNEYLVKQLNEQFLKTRSKKVLKTFQPGLNESKTRRPTSVGRSYNGKDMYCKEEPNKDKIKIDSTKIKHTLDKSWDPTYPSGHKSMVDLSVNRSPRHEDRCRSRSLSPGVLLDEHPGSEKRSKKKFTGTKTSRNDAVTSDHVTEDSGLRGLMDENGILWDDMDTLPDVSDSELGRMSPSGSEAIATKTTHVPSQGTKRMVSSHTAIHVPHARCTDIKSEISKRNTRRVFNYNSDKLSSGSVKKSKSYSNFKFRPIKQASLEQTSLSDKDISSGGKEIYKYITKPPEVENYDTHCISGYSPTLSRSDMSLSVRSNDGEKSYRNVESLQDKIQRISERFSNQRSSRNSRSTPSLSEKIEEIAEKYRHKRKDIFEGKGVTPIGNKSLQNLTGRQLTVQQNITVSEAKATSAMAFNNSNHFDNTMKNSYSQQTALNNNIQPHEFESTFNKPKNQVPNNDPWMPLPASTGNISKKKSELSNVTSMEEVRNEASFNRKDTQQVQDSNQTEQTKSFDPFHIYSECKPENVEMPSQDTSNVTLQGEAMNCNDALRYGMKPNKAINGNHLDSGTRREPLATTKEDYTDIRRADSKHEHAGKDDDDASSAKDSAVGYTVFKDEESDSEHCMNQKADDLSFGRELHESIDLTLRKPVTTTQESHSSGHGEVATDGAGIVSKDKYNASDGGQSAVNASLKTPSRAVVSAFAEEIDDVSMPNCGSNTQSLLDLPGDITDNDVDMDTDTESVRRNLFESVRRVKKIFPDEDTDDTDYSDFHATRYRKTMSSASSQG